MNLQESLRSQIDDKLDKNQRSMSEQLAQSTNIVRAVTERLTKLDETNKRVIDVADDLKTLQNVLQNPKQRGVLGEYYLEQILQNLLPPGSFKMQYKIAEGLIVDAVIMIDDKLLPIDSKFSLENYNRLVEAKGQHRLTLEKMFIDDIKKRIDETSKYIHTNKGTLDQALMFIPSEAIYYDLLNNNVGVRGVASRNLMQYATIDKKVVIVGPTTLASTLQIISKGLKSIQIQKETEKIKSNIEQLEKHLLSCDAYFKKLGNSLSATVNHYNSSYKELGKIDRDIYKITDKSIGLEPEIVERPKLD